MATDIDNFIAARTVLSDVDGEAGRLIIRGHDLEELAGRRSFEEVIALLWSETVALSGDVDDLSGAIGRARVAAFGRQEAILRRAPIDPVDIMRFLLAAEPTLDRLEAPLAAVASVAIAAALASRHARGLALIEPDAAASHAADLLRMITGDAPGMLQTHAFETYLVAAVDHGLNASTFAARVVGSTLADMPSSIVAAYCALTGPLHGGAPGPVLDMMDAVAESGDASNWIANELAAGRRLMGFGHRIYRVRDPRADVLKTALKKLGKTSRMALAEEIERAALLALSTHRSARRLDVNTEFYTALLLEALEIPRNSFTAVFAAARSPGWVAHIREQEAVGRLIRPRSEYIGKIPMRAA